MTERKKLIEVALPLEAINRESVREKSIRHGHPSALHLWWARRPLAACRAVIFGSLVDDPSSHPDRFPTEEAQGAERRRLFDIIERLVAWESTTNEAVLEEAREEIRKSTRGAPPRLLDPFCGGGSIPLEGQRLGLETYASDLNPVAVLITKALVEIPPKFTGCPPVHPDARRGIGSSGTWIGAAGLAEDVRRYGAWMREEAVQRIGHLYPKVALPKELGGGEATVIGWLWARTVKCPNPVCGARMPLVRSFALSTKPGKESWVEPLIDRTAKTVRFEVGRGNGTLPEPPKTGRGASFRCLVCNQLVPEGHIKAEGMAGRMDSQLMAIVADGPRGRIYVPPTPEHESLAHSVEATWAPTEELANDPRNIWCAQYGLRTYGDLFTARQLVALRTFSDLVKETHSRVVRDAVSAGMANDGSQLAEGGTGAAAYADAVCTYLGLTVSRLANRSSTLCFWDTGGEKVQQVFARQALPMTWDYVEANPLSDSSGNWTGQLLFPVESLEYAPATQPPGHVEQIDARSAKAPQSLVATDPPYYDNIGYSDLSDFFYVWLRQSLRTIYPQLFATVLTPKGAELIATPYRFDGDRGRAESFFERGLADAFSAMRDVSSPEFPMTFFYAFKQAEGNQGRDSQPQFASTGWETMLSALIRSGFTVQGTWPMRTEFERGLKRRVNALASSIVLVCRPRAAEAGVTTKRDFVAALKGELPGALRRLQHENIAPVDLAQAAIGPGMSVFSRFAKVIEPDGSAMTVRSALVLINAALDQILAEQEGEFDSDTRWAVTWFEQHGMGEGPSGDAETLSTAKDTAVSGLVRAGIIKSGGGKVRLLRRDELPEDWNPATDQRPTAWEGTQHLMRALDRYGESGAGEMVARIGGYGELARDLAYRLYIICDRKGWADDALAYNQLVVAWPEIERLAHAARTGEQQQTLSL